MYLPVNRFFLSIWWNAFFLQENEDAVERVKMKETHSRRYNNSANEMEVNVYGNKVLQKKGSGKGVKNKISRPQRSSK